MIDLALYKILKVAGEHGYARFSDFKLVISNPRTLSRKISVLLSKGLLIKDSVGYRITDKGVEVLSLMEKILSILGEKVAAVDVDKVPHRYYAPLLEKYARLLLDYFGEKLLGIVLFGSIARGDWDIDSDIDILVVVEGWDSKPMWERIRELYGIREKLRETREYRAAVEAGYIPILQHYPLGGREALRFHKIYLDIVLDGIVIYERGGYISGIMDSVRNKLLEYGARRISRPDGRYYWLIKDIKAGEVFTL